MLLLLNYHKFNACKSFWAPDKDARFIIRNGRAFVIAERSLKTNQRILPHVDLRGESAEAFSKLGPEGEALKSLGLSWDEIVFWGNYAANNGVTVQGFVETWRLIFALKNEDGTEVWKAMYISPHRNLIGGERAHKELLISIFFISIKQFPYIYDSRPAADTILRGRVTNVRYNEVWKKIFDLCHDVPRAKHRLVDDMFAYIKSSPAPNKGDSFYYLYSGAWISDIAVWRKMMGNPLAGGLIAYERREELEVIEATFRGALSAEQLRRIFQLDKFNGDFLSAWEGKKFDIDEVAELWGALYDYFMPKSVPRKILLGLTAEYSVAGLVRKWAAEKWVSWVKPKLVKWSDEVKAREGSFAALKILGLALSGKEIYAIFQVSKYEGNFHEARMAWTYDEESEATICRAFLARYPNNFDWIVTQLCVIFPPKDRDNPYRRANYYRNTLRAVRCNQAVKK